jgi:hypothetical protein
VATAGVADFFTLIYSRLIFQDVWPLARRPFCAMPIKNYDKENWQATEGQEAGEDDRLLYD